MTNRICDLIIAHADRITPTIARVIMTLARLTDPTESHRAADIRDTLRDNCDFPIH